MKLLFLVEMKKLCVENHKYLKLNLEMGGSHYLYFLFQTQNFNSSSAILYLDFGLNSSTFPTFGSYVMPATSQEKILISYNILQSDQPNLKNNIMKIILPFLTLVHKSTPSAPIKTNLPPQNPKFLQFFFYSTSHLTRLPKHWLAGLALFPQIQNFNIYYPILGLDQSKKSQIIKIGSLFLELYVSEIISLFLCIQTNYFVINRTA